MNSEQIRAIEELTLNAWPAPRQVLYDGWVMRLGNGYTRRANSVTPLSGGTIDVWEKIRFCEAVYARHGLPTIFKLTVASQPPGLDAALAGAGHRACPGAIVQVADLEASQSACDSRVSELEVDEWSNALVQFGYLSGQNQLQTLRTIVGAIPLPHLRAVLCERDEALACGLAVLQGNWLGLFDIVTAPAHRRRGLGAAMLAHLLNWGQAQGASRAYLQVVAGNEVAQRLYARFGFHAAYEYEYWQRDAST